MSKVTVTALSKGRQDLSGGSHTSYITGRTSATDTNP
jgi:hypothetical protein